MNKTTFSKFMDAKGITPKDFAAAGIPYGTVLAHYYGKRNMSLTAARKYASCLNIPISEFVEIISNPDLWPPAPGPADPPACQDA